MECRRRWRWFSSACFLILVEFALRETMAVRHRHVGQFTAVGTTHSLLELSAISFIDDVEVGSYNKVHQQIIIKVPWTSKALGVNYITQRRNLLVDHEKHFLWMMHYFAKNDTNHDRNHTGQLLADCEMDNDIKVNSHVHIIWDGEEIYRIDEEVGHWEYLKPEFKKYQHILESPFWTDLRKLYMNQYCVDLMRKIVWYSILRDNVPPEVTVSRRVNREGSIILSCTATGFYPRSILLRWEKDGKLGVWGKETSTGTLPNADSTFYLRVTLELPPEDSGMGYTCVVEHIELKTPAVYPVPEKPTREKPWVLTLGIMLAVILLLSCAGIFTARKKRKRGLHYSFGAIVLH
ncbi:zinc-alpha-2-glycoprotein-like isoform X2 [Phascolarctos cinereus]|uniref:Major histocompatibility complex class I-related gene protein-like isoform X2 n=1 Tax=Phascolarctos cinereus TaxID=38626 RepID=A0A6P5LJV4_PHACI|nr:major histocompatibility complex class I-related gene protein-like isoform X2 [Phascolarctos cinereus]